MSQQPPQLTPNQQAAVDLMRSGANVFLTGGAGTGKSTIIRAYMAATTNKVFLLAPTGIAASRIGGMTIHRCFCLKQRIYAPEQMMNLSAAQVIAYQEVDTLIIDEISMTRVDILHAIDLSLQQANEDSRPFGGKQIILVGDLYQLSPVAGPGERHILEEWYGGIYPFHAPGWRYGDFQSVCLDAVQRQADPVFIDILNSLRIGGNMNYQEIETYGNLRWVEALQQLNRLISIRFDPPEGATVLSPSNSLVAYINRNSDRLHHGDIHRFEAKVWGHVDFDEISAEKILELRIGSRVILLANKNIDEKSFAYSNGDQGVILEITETSLKIRLDRGNEIDVGKSLWENKSMNVDMEKRSIEEKLIGTCNQFPVKLGYAITIHKSQGLTLEKVHLSLQSPMFSSGMLYVALSRCRSLAGLSSSRPLHPYDVHENQDVDTFYQSLDQNAYS